MAHKNRDIDELIQMLDDSAEFMAEATRKFKDRNERVLNRYSDGDEDGVNGLYDSSLPAYLERLPKTTIQKLPDFIVKSGTNDPNDSIVLEYIAKEILLKDGATSGYGMLQRHWIMERNSAAFGMCAVASPFVQEYGRYTVGFEPLYWGDVFIEPYASNINSANWVIYRSLYTKGDIESMIDNVDRDVDDAWDVSALKELIDDKRTGSSVGGSRASLGIGRMPNNMYQFFVYSDLYETVTFHVDTKKILRRVPNESGRPHVIGRYFDFDGLSVFGRSLVDMGWVQHNVLTLLLRAFADVVYYNTDPAMLVKGLGLDEGNFSLKRASAMFLGDDSGSIDLLEKDTSVVNHFTSTYSFLKSLGTEALPNAHETRFSSEIGNPTYSQTPAGVRSQNAKQDIDNNYSRKGYEQFFETWLENALNIYISKLRSMQLAGEANDEMKVPMITLSDEYANLVRENSPEAVNENNQVMFDLREVKDVKIDVEFETTRAMAKEEDLERLSKFISALFDMAKADKTMMLALRDVIPLLVEEVVKSSSLDNSSKIIEAVREGVARQAAAVDDAPQVGIAGGEEDGIQV